jgi:pyruvate formate lyase activating enzyme
MAENTYVFNIQHYSLHDGPGIRTIVFLKGCPMRCRWCCNPESQQYNREISYVANKCIGLSECGYCKDYAPQNAITFEDDKAVIDMERCSHCLECAEVCPSKAIKSEGKEYGIKELADIVERDSAFYGHGDGGLTVSGGEPLTHGNFLIALLKEAKKRRITTAIETCGYADYEVLFEAAKYLDTILFDIKSLNDEKHREYTGKSNKKILENFERLCRDYPNLKKKVRTPVIPGFNDSVEYIKNILDFIKDKPNVSYEPLPYHSFGRGKYTALGRDYPMGDAKLDETIMKEITKEVEESEINKEEVKNFGGDI